MSRLLSFGFGVLFGLLFCANIALYYRHKAHNIKEYTTRDTVIDTIYHTTPIQKDSVVIKYISKSLPVHKTIYDTVKVDSKDSAIVDIPITQKKYTDSTYTAWVSGYEPKLDSIHIIRKSVNTTTLKPIYIDKKAKKWGVGFQVGARLDAKNIQPYIGIGVSYNVFMW